MTRVTLCENASLDEAVDAIANSLRSSTQRSLNQSQAILSMAINMSYKGFILKVLKPYVLKQMENNGIPASWEFKPTSRQSLTGKRDSEIRIWDSVLKYGVCSFDVVFKEDAEGTLSVFVNGDFVTFAKNGVSTGFDYKLFMYVLLGGR